MATYATNTNPFIKSESTNGVTGRCCMKDAPGMAKPKSSIADASKSEVPSLLFREQDTEFSLSNSEFSSSCRDRPIDSNCQDCCSTSDDINKSISQDLEITSEEPKPADLSSLVDDLVVTETKRDSLDSPEEKTTTEVKDIHIEKQPEFDYILDNEDEVEDDNDNDSPPMEKDTRKQQHIELIKKLRLQLRDLERYAYERGELEQVPPSVIAERQTVILETLKDKLSLNICMDEIEKLELDQLKKQVDKEINDLLDPLITKEYLLSQLKTQLTDLERYISHLHGTLDKKNCRCHLHGCSSKSEESTNANLSKGSTLMDNNSLPTTSKLIRSLITQLICSDIKLQESAKKEKEFEAKLQHRLSDQEPKDNSRVKEVQFHDGAAWSLHLDKVILATDSLMNLFFLEPQFQRPTDKPVDKSLVESVVRRQLAPAIRDLLSYGLLDPNSTNRSTSYASLFFDPYYLITSLTCFPSSQKSNSNADRSSPIDKIHVWNIIEEYYKSRNEPGFKTSSVKTLSQSFNLEPTMNGPIKITSKQALLIAIDDILETLSKSKPDGPESHFRAFIYTALNRSKLSTWLRLVFKNKSIARRYYHNFSFVCQVEKMDKFLKTIEPLNQIQFKLNTDVESIEQFISAF